jgi:hypothetical protein
MNRDFIRIIHKISNKIPFSFSRFGDGEWNAVFDKKGHNCDKHPYYRDMNESLREVLNSYKNQYNYFLGMQRFAWERRKQDIERFLGKKKINWWDGDCFYKMSISGDLKEMFKVLKDRTVVLVGPDYLKGFKYKNLFVHVPDKNCWKEKDRIVRDTKILLDEVEDMSVVLFVASMPTNVMIDELYRQYGDVHSFIDVGSVLDPYVGKVTRSYHHDIIKNLKYGRGNKV